MHHAVAFHSLAGEDMQAGSSGLTAVDSEAIANVGLAGTDGVAIVDSIHLVGHTEVVYTDMHRADRVHIAEGLEGQTSNGRQRGVAGTQVETIMLPTVRVGGVAGDPGGGVDNDVINREVTALGVGFVGDIAQLKDACMPGKAIRGTVIAHGIKPFILNVEGDDCGEVAKRRGDGVGIFHAVVLAGHGVTRKHP